MGVQEIADKMKSSVASAGFDHSVKFDTGSDGVIVIDGATDLDHRRADRLHHQAVARRSGVADLRRSEPDHGVHDRQDQDRRRHVGRHGAQPVARLIRSQKQNAAHGRRFAFDPGVRSYAANVSCSAFGLRPAAPACPARRRARRRPAPAPASGAARTDPAWRARRSSPPRSRSARSKARRRPAGSRAWPRRAASAIACRISAEPMPALFSDGSTASGPSSSAGRPPSPSARRPTAAPCRRRAPAASRATKARPSDGRRPRRSFSDDFFRRFGPWRGRAAPRARRHRRAVSATMAKDRHVVARFQRHSISTRSFTSGDCSTSEPGAGDKRPRRVIREACSPQIT